MSEITRREKFKEQFPSLVGQEDCACSDETVYFCTAFSERTIQKHCLDKQKVREVLNSSNFKKAEIQTSEQAYRYRERRRFIAELILKLRLEE